jgi:hypothetical protein
MDEAELAVTTVLTLTDQVGVRLEHGELAGQSVALPGSSRRVEAEQFARLVLDNVEFCRELEDRPDQAVGIARWHELAEQLRAIERATRGEP